jgi:hypothetical protein
MGAPGLCCIWIRRESAGELTVSFWRPTADDTDHEKVFQETFDTLDAAEALRLAIAKACESLDSDFRPHVGGQVH